MVIARWAVAAVAVNECRCWSVSGMALYRGATASCALSSTTRCRLHCVVLGPAENTPRLRPATGQKKDVDVVPSRRAHSIAALQMLRCAERCCHPIITYAVHFRHVATMPRGALQRLTHHNSITPVPPTATLFIHYRDHERFRYSSLRRGLTIDGGPSCAAEPQGTNTEGTSSQRHN